MVFISPSWMLLVAVVQAVATVIVVAMLLIVPSTQAYGQCILTLAGFGKAQMDLMAVGQLVAHSLYSLMLALDTIVTMHATGLIPTSGAGGSVHGVRGQERVLCGGCERGGLAWSGGTWPREPSAIPRTVERDSKRVSARGQAGFLLAVPLQHDAAAARAD
ncbi:hypothetical protein BC940DRAFT_345954 [Gongronella butleri]|nr:hypothetical protein BC940DRAFT_345954 [Gongronella butleri]